MPVIGHDQLPDCLIHATYPGTKHCCFIAFHQQTRLEQGKHGKTTNSHRQVSLRRLYNKSHYFQPYSERVVQHFCQAPFCKDQSMLHKPDIMVDQVGYADQPLAYYLFSKCWATLLPIIKKKGVIYCLIDSQIFISILSFVSHPDCVEKSVEETLRCLRRTFNLIKQAHVNFHAVQSVCVIVFKSS